MASLRSSLLGRRIVVAAANSRLVAYLTTVLTEADCRVFRAYDAQAAYELTVQMGNIDLVVTNSCVGTVQGDILVNALRRARPHLPVLHISAGQERDREVEARIPADVPSLQEPFTDEQLIQAVRAALR